jgi:uncharacterized protein YkwD
MRGWGIAVGLVGLLLAPPAPAAETPLAGDVLAAVNGVRAAHGLPALAEDERLDDLSQSYAGIMAATSCMAHDCGGLGRVGERAARAGLAYRLIGEALAGGPRDAGRVVALWLASESHRAILLNPEINSAGVGYAGRDGEGPSGYGHYWVLTVSLPE